MEVKIKVFKLLAILLLVVNISLAYSMSKPVDDNTEEPLDINVMEECSFLRQPATDATDKAEKSSNYCSFDGRYVAKAQWQRDENIDGGGGVEYGKELITYASYSEARDSMSSKGYRLPTINELARLISFQTHSAVDTQLAIFDKYPIIDQWFKEDGVNISSYYDGYIISSTYNKSDHDVFAVDIKSKQLVAIDPLATYPATKALYVLGVSDYFQIINKEEPSKCLQFVDNDQSLILTSCNDAEIKQRWFYDESNFHIRNQYRASGMDASKKGYCIDHGGADNHTIAYAYNCDNAGEANIQYDIVVDGVAGNTLALGKYVKLKANDGLGTPYLTNDSGSMVSADSIDNPTLEGAQLWMLQY